MPVRAPSAEPTLAERKMASEPRTMPPSLLVSPARLPRPGNERRRQGQGEGECGSGVWEGEGRRKSRGKHSKGSYLHLLILTQDPKGVGAEREGRAHWAGHRTVNGAPDVKDHDEHIGHDRRQRPRLQLQYGGEVEVKQPQGGRREELRGPVAADRERSQRRARHAYEDRAADLRQDQRREIDQKE